MSDKTLIERLRAPGVVSLVGDLGIDAANELSRLQSELAEEKSAREGMERKISVYEASVSCHGATALLVRAESAEALVASLRARVEAGEKALRELARWRLKDGSDCWCSGWFRGAPQESHSPGCKAARALLAEGQERDG